MSTSGSRRHPHIQGLNELMEHYVDGSAAAFARMYGLLEPRLRGFLMKLVHDEATVDDLLQVTLLKAHLARERFELQGGDPDGAVQGWYFAIARNVAMDHLRERYRGEKRASLSGSQYPAGELADASHSVEDLEVEAEEEQAVIDRVRSAIAHLPPGQREVVELHKLRGMTMAQIAERLQIREGAVRVRAHRAYRALARLLAVKTSVLYLLLEGPW